ncbi:MAG TPA: DUF262 domain-containing protein [Gemmatimonadales bacterium]|jgi:hypothetical protein
MSEQRIQSQDISVADVFQSFYVVPDYQREYVWEEAEVEQLLNDIYGELGGAEGGKAPEYFIGSIVVCPQEKGLLELIDGQQRMTTLFLTLCAIRDHAKALKKAPPGSLGSQIAATSTDESGQDVDRYRLDLQYEDSGDILQRIAQGTPTPKKGPGTLSVVNILKAYEVVRRFLKVSFGEDDVAARRFYGYLTNKVKLIRIQAEDVAKALKIFETINDRGVGLNAMDLLKNLLFMKASRQDFEALKTTWKELQDTLFAIGEKPLRFLRYFIFSRYEVDTLREDEIYVWLSKNEKLCGYATKPVAFAKELLSAAKAYRSFFEGKDSNGNKSNYLENMQLLGGKAARQHLILLLAGRDLEPVLFDRLCREVENLFFCYVVTREPTRDFERNFALWAREIRAARSEQELNVFFQNRFEKAKADLAVRFRDAMERLTTYSLQAYRTRYVLGKLTQSVELAAYGETEGSRWLSRFTGKGFDIEHVFPQSPSDKAKEEFGEHNDPGVAQRLGNLLLVEESINSSLGNRAFSEKKSVYPQSQLLMTRAIAARPSVGVNTKIDAAVREFDPYEEWHEATVERRQRELAALACRVWSVPVGSAHG